jgi:hypothetical protein
MTYLQLYKFTTLNSLLCKIIYKYATLIKRPFESELLYETTNIYGFLFYNKSNKWTKIRYNNFWYIDYSYI